jgi:multiple sugar transport system substrate-binding protein
VKRTTSTVALLASAALMLAACGREEEPPSAEGTQAESVAEGPAEGAIEVWAMGAEGENLDVLGEAFTKENPDATVEVTPVPWEGAHDKIATAIAAGETPDVSLIGTTWMGEFAKTGGLDPTPEDLFDPAEFFEGPWESTVVEGTSYGVPWYVETRTLFYRTDLADQAGLEPPTNWEELTAFGQGLQDQGAKNGIYLQPGQTGAWQTFMPFAWQNGAQLIDGAEYTIDTPEMVEALEYYTSFFDEGLSQNTPLEPGALETGFVDGTIGSFISGPWHVGLINDAGGEGTFNVVTLPGKDEGIGTSFVGGGNLAVFDASDNRDSAWKFVQFLTEAETQQLWYETINDLPSVQSAWDASPLADDPMLATFGEQLQNADAPPAVPTWEQVAAAIDSDIEKAVRGELSPAEAVADMQQQANSIGTGL